MQTSLKSANSAIKCRVTDNTSTEKIKIAETTASAETCENRVHKHRFRRKKRQKNRRNNQEEYGIVPASSGQADSRTEARDGRISSPIMTPTSKTMPRIYTFHKRKLTRRYIVCSGERRNRNFILLINRGQSATIAKITAFSNLKYGPD